MIYLIHDVLHHNKHHTAGASTPKNFVEAVEGAAVDLFRLAALDQKPRVCARLRSVLAIWEAESVLASPILKQIKETVQDPSAGTAVAGKETTKDAPATAKDLPYIMPASHGDPSLPFHELPAANFMPHIIPNKSIAMRAEDIRPLQFKPGPADEVLAGVVKKFLKEVERLEDTWEYLDDEGIVPDIDDLGQMSYRDEDGELVEDSYYGWSRSFCERMKDRLKVSQGRGRRTRSRSYSSGSSRSRSRHKRRRLSSSSDGSSRGPSQGLDASNNGRAGPVRSASPPPALGHSLPGQARHNTTPQSFAVPVPPVHAMPFLLGPNGLPIPPPRPPNWNCPWPPPLLPPPPPPGYSSSWAQR